MAYDESLADRVRDLLSVRPGYSERKMFGGIGFMLGGHMTVGVMGDGLIVRHDPALRAAIHARDGVGEFDFTGRPMKGFAFVGPEAFAGEGELATWVDEAAEFAATLPTKQ